MKFTFRLFAIVYAAFLGCTVWAAATATLTILHTNDTHGHLFSFSYPTIMALDSEEAKLKVKKDVGGAARRATLIKRIRTELAAKNTPCLLFDAGDLNDGSVFSTEYNGEADIAVMNQIGYDFAVFGNHDYNNTLAEVKKLASLAHHKIVCANVIENTTGKTLLPPYTITHVGDLKIGIFGLVTESTATYKAVKEGLTVENELDTAHTMVKKLRPLVDILIMVSHIGIDDDRKVAAENPGLDIIVGGHSHTYIEEGVQVWYSDALKTDQVNGTVIVQAHKYGDVLGRLDLLFEKGKSGWHVQRWHDTLIPVTSDIPDDPETAKVIAKFWDPIKSKYAGVVGTAAQDFSTRGDDHAEYNLVADAIAEFAHSDFAFQNLGGVRSAIPKGEITITEMLEVDPFKNKLTTFDLSGKELKNILQTFAPFVSSSIHYRIIDRQLVEATINGAPIDENKIYHGISNNYFSSHALKNNSTVVNTNKDAHQAILDYIRSQGVISPKYDNRRVIIDEHEREAESAFVNALDNIK